MTDSQTDRGWMDRWKEGRMGRQTNGGRDKQTNKPTSKQTKRQAGKHIDPLTKHFYLDLHRSRLQKLSTEFKKEQETVQKEFDNER